MIPPTLFKVVKSISQSIFDQFESNWWKNNQFKISADKSFEEPSSSMSDSKKIKEGMWYISPWVLFFRRVNSAILSIRNLLIVVASEIGVEVSFYDVDSRLFILNNLKNYQIQEVNENWKVEETDTTESFPKIWSGLGDETCWQKEASDNHWCCKSKA